MPLDVNIDDNNTTLIQYQGAWTYITGSTRQWEGGVHTTGQAGASATFNFRGYQLWVHGTIPAGSGRNVITVSIDGGSSDTIIRTSNGSAVYDEVYFTSPLLPDTSHTIVVTNQGSTTSGNSEFMLDRFEFQTEDDVPSFPAFSAATPSSTRNPTSSSTTTSGSSSSSSTTPWGAIIGAIVSCLLVVILILLFIIWRKQRSKKGKDVLVLPSDVLTPTPFLEPSELLGSDRSLPVALPEKSAYQRPQYPLDVDSGNTANAISASTLRPVGPSPSGSNSTGTSLVDPHATNFTETYNFPPPSYQQDLVAP